MVQFLDPDNGENVDKSYIKPEMELRMINIIYAALPCVHKQKRRHFHAKTTSAKLYIYIGVGARDL